MDIKAKQDYLCKEIIQANYDPEEFQDYIQNIKGLSLQVYSMNQLMDIVEKFKKAGKDVEGQKSTSKKSKIKQNVQADNSRQFQKNMLDQKELMNLKKQNMNQIQKDSFNSSTKVYHEIITKTIYPIIYKRIFIKKEKIAVKIRSYSKIQEHSLFRSSYVAYHLQTSGFNWSVKRRFKDFQWLHSKLSEMYPGLPIPPIPQKTPVRYFDDKHLEQRMIYFQKFLNRLTHIPEICSDKILEEFLNVSTAQQLRVCKEQYQNTINSKGKKIYSVKGLDVINMSSYLVEHKDHEFYSKSQQLIKCLNGQISAFQKSLKIATERAFELSSTFGQVFQHFNHKKQVSGSKIFELMGDFVYEIGYKLDNEYIFIKNNMQNYWNYEQKYLQNITQSMVKINKQQYEMLNKYKNISNVTDEIASGENCMESKLFSEYLLNKQTYRIKLSFLLQEMERYEKQDFSILAGDWAESLRNYIGEVKNEMISGADQLTKAICLEEGKNLMEVEYISNKNIQRYSKMNLRQ